MKTFNIFLFSTLISCISFAGTCRLSFGLTNKFLVIVDDKTMGIFDSAHEQIYNLKSLLNANMCNEMQADECSVSSNMMNTGYLVMAKDQRNSHTKAGVFKSIEYANAILQEYKKIGSCK